MLAGKGTKNDQSQIGWLLVQREQKFDSTPTTSYQLAENAKCKPLSRKVLRPQMKANRILLMLNVSFQVYPIWSILASCSQD